MNIRKARWDDLLQIEEIYRDAREYMKVSGNPLQWGEYYPPSDLTRSDIERERLFVACDAEVLLAVFYFAEQEDEAYKVIRDGSWLNDAPYAVIHRMALACGARGKGVVSQCFDYCFSCFGNLKIDTHKDNIPMQRALEKNGFSYCGRVNVGSDHTPGDDGERLAYQRTK